MSFLSNNLLKSITSKPLIWTNYISFPSNRLFSTEVGPIIAYNNINTFVALTPYNTQIGMYDGGIITSSDGGNNWYDFTYLLQNEDWSSITYGNGKFVAIARGFSTSAVVFNSDLGGRIYTTLPNGNWSSVAYGNNKFVALDGNGGSAYSNNGIDWTYSPNSSTIIPPYGNQIVFGNGTFVCINPFQQNVIPYSTDGITWSSTSFPYYLSLGDIVYGNGKFITIGSYNGSTVSMQSNDGINWTILTGITNLPTYGLAYGNGRFIGETGNLYGGTPGTAYSDNGINWKTASTTFNANAVVFGNNKFFRFGQTPFTPAAYSNII